MPMVFTIDLLPKILVVCDENQCSVNALCMMVSSIIPRASSYTEKTSCPSARNQAATTGPVLSSTRKRTYALSATSGMKEVFSKARAANSKHA